MELHWCCNSNGDNINRDGDVMEVVICNRHGGFCLSERAIHRVAELKGIKLYPETQNSWHTTYWTVPEKPKDVLEGKEWHELSLEDRQKSNRSYKDHTFDVGGSFDRSDIHLVQTVKELGVSANGDYASLKVVEIPDDVEWKIEEYDGCEWVAEKHRTWS